eukprot:CAMPEP_0170618508 /NCGR_PEP_ID=MMETSP0224-20130122/26998_1 /TAXON_ID=285029 /ORGANISM="Togula jolla, Strain CCCM 725" /LENGTH=386 /DNA_ID=CAMNT_0010944491 /DNA_START=84 /DNA_END=1244 /DNA_ORIENTATION=-
MAAGIQAVRPRVELPGDARGWVPGLSSSLRSGRSHARFTGNVAISQRRLDEFLEAEFAYLSSCGYSTIKLEHILAHSTTRELAILIQKELPARFATRLRQIESTIPEWRELAGLARVHDILKVSFRNLRLVNVDTDSLDAFTDVIVDLRKRHKGIIAIFWEIGRELKRRGHWNDQEIHHWIHQFMNSRMGTEMLTAHYVLVAGLKKPGTGLVDTRCNPATVVQSAIEHVRENFGVPDINITLQAQQGDIEFSFIPSYLFWITEELLKNSIVATMMHGEKTNSKKDIKVIVCADSHHVGIQISDKGGGIPIDLTERIWEYLFSTTPHEMQSHFREETPLSGPGMGLPLCRLYVQYLGGSLNLMSMPGIGLDVYLVLNRIESGQGKVG